jgi:ketosteroid isomerase-like protein
LSDDDVGIVGAFYDAVAKGDVDAVLALLQPDVRWEAPDPLPYGGTLDGHPGFREYRRRMHETVADYRITRERTFRCAGQVVVTGRMEATVKATGIDLESPFAHIWTLRGGKIAAREYHVDTHALMRAFTGTGHAQDDAALSVAMGVYEATGRGDQAKVASLLAPDVEWRIPDELPYGGLFHGREGVMESRGIASEVFVRQRFTPHHVFASGDRIVGIGWMDGVVQGTNAPVEAPFMHIWTVGRGEVEARRQYTDTDTILAALAGAAAN